MQIQDARLSMSEISSRRGWLVRGGDGVEEGESGEGSNPAGWRAKSGQKYLGGRYMYLHSPSSLRLHL